MFYDNFGYIVSLYDIYILLSLFMISICHFQKEI